MSRQLSTVWLPMENKAAVDRLDDRAEDGSDETSGSRGR